MERALKRQVDMEKNIQLHYQLVEDRKVQALKEVEMAIKIQAIIRGKFGRKAAAEAKHQVISIISHSNMIGMYFMCKHCIRLNFQCHNMCLVR